MHLYVSGEGYSIMWQNGWPPNIDHTPPHPVTQLFISLHFSDRTYLYSIRDFLFHNCNSFWLQISYFISSINLLVYQNLHTCTCTQNSIIIK